MSQKGIFVGNQFLWITILVVGFSALTIAFALLRWCGYFRNCKQCGFRLTRLHAMDYQTDTVNAGRDCQVWACQSCGAVAKVLANSFMTSHAPCPTCRAKTTSYVKENVENATEVAAGAVLIVEQCEVCDYLREEIYPTPMLAESRG